MHGPKEMRELIKRITSRKINFQNVHFEGGKDQLTSINRFYNNDGTIRLLRKSQYVITGRYLKFKKYIESIFKTYQYSCCLNELKIKSKCPDYLFENNVFKDNLKDKYKNRSPKTYQEYRSPPKDKEPTTIMNTSP